MNIGQIVNQTNGFMPIKAEQPQLAGGVDFSAMLKDSLQSIETTQVENQNAIQKLLTTGEGNASEVLVNMNKAEAQIKTASVVRDKLVENYQQIMNMQI